MKTESRIPVINVGILSANEVSFTFISTFTGCKDDRKFDGRWTARFSADDIVLKNDSEELKYKSEVILSPGDQKNSSFIIHAVTIGVNFHWQRSEDQVFKGDLKLIAEDGKITLINVISLEEYLKSVISSEMSATSSEELLKAHSVISRGWLLAQSEKHKFHEKSSTDFSPEIKTDNEIIKWYDREEHQNFDVCADDHCQRYQGITRETSPVVKKVIDQTFGEVLTYNGAVCDTRYYKCCGGVTELFENVWEPVNHPYLRKVTDNPVPPAGYSTDLAGHSNAEKWITGNPDAFCNTSDSAILGQVLNDYDQETDDFFRWKVRYKQTELSELVHLRTGIDFGIITDLNPLERGVSGRIIRLGITGTKKNMIIGKELEIRKALSKSHLYSSCFYVERIEEKGVVWFILHGAGWGHGVGLCQIGAAVMGSKGYTYREILDHYFPGSVLEKRY